MDLAAGLPLVGASIDGDELVLRQQRFAYDEDTLERDETPTTWLVPVQLRSGDERWSVLLDGVEVRTPLADPTAPLVVNAGGHGFYRVAYSDELRSRMSGEVLGSLDTLERYNLVDDAWNEVVAGRLPAVDFLAFVEGFGGERELAVWQSIMIGLARLGRLLDDDALPSFQRRVRELLGPVVADLGEPTEGEHDLRGKLRGLLTAALAIQGGRIDPRQGADLLDRQEAQPGSVDPELVAAATAIVASTGDETTFERMLAGYRDAPTPQDQLRYLYSWPSSTPRR